MRTPKNEVITFRCPSGMKDALVIYSELYCLNVSEIIRRACLELMTCSYREVDRSANEAVQAGCRSQVKTGN